MTPDATTPAAGDFDHRFSVEPPVEPMLAKPIDGLPESAQGLVFEPKWDGFRVLVYRRGEDVVIQGRMRAADAAATGAWDLSYAFPEMIARFRRMAAPDVVLDGELVVIHEGRLAFDALQGRLRPRKEAGGWKIAELARDHPTSFVGFDALGVAGADLRAEPFRRRRQVLAQVLAGEDPPLYLTPTTADLDVARRWVSDLPGAGLDGVIARRTEDPYTPGKRTLFKIKQSHTVDVVCAGWRPFAKPGPDGGEVVGSVLLGLFDSAGSLHMIGAMSAFPMAVRVELGRRFTDLAAGPEHPWFDPSGRAPGIPSRWSRGRSSAWHPLRPELVAEVSYNQAESGRLRHLASFVRWRPDKTAAECTMDGLFSPEPLRIERVLTAVDQSRGEVVHSLRIRDGWDG